MQRQKFALIFTLGFALVAFASPARAQYRLVNLASNQVGQSAHTDPLSVNAWGLVRATSFPSPWWVADNNSGWSTLYDKNGVKQGLVVEIPTASGGGVGSATGLVFNASQEFPVGGWPSIFIFATLDGTISGWTFKSDANNAIIAVNNSANKSVYTALAITNNASGNMLYAVDNANNKVEMYDGTFTWKGNFQSDPNVPAGFSAFGIRDIGGTVYVTFADASGGPGGVIDKYKEDGMLIGTFAQGAPLNQPWGLAAAPANFGPLSNTILVANNNNAGTINGFNSNGQHVGVLKDTNGVSIRIDQLWAIDFGGGNTTNGETNTLFFTAGPHNNLAGTFGKIIP